MYAIAVLPLAVALSVESSILVALGSFRTVGLTLSCRTLGASYRLERCRLDHSRQCVQSDANQLRLPIGCAR